MATLAIPSEETEPADAISCALAAILRARRAVPSRRSALVALTGIDGCGKGYLAERIVEALRGSGVRAVGIPADPWLNLPQRRFNPRDPARHFYEHALRLDEMFEQLVLPLREQRRLRLLAAVVDETATEPRPRTYEFDDVDVVVLEGIFLLKPAYRDHYDLSFWVDCSFETALERALQRRQEGLPVTETIRAYETIYFPAQQIHLERDDPRAAASVVLVNDPRLALSRHS